MEKKYLAPSVSSAVNIVNLLSKYRYSEATLTEISNEVNVNNSTCYRILHTLVEKKILIHNKETKKFSLGPYLMILGKRANELIGYVDIAKTYLSKIGELTNATCGIVQRVENRWTYMEKYIPDSPYSISIKVGQSFDLTAGATGKLLMAYLSTEEQEEKIKNIGIKKYTSKTEISKEGYLNNLEKVYEQGFSISNEEHYEGILGLSFPVFNSLEEVEFGFTVIMLNNKKKERVNEIAYQIKAITDELSMIISSNSENKEKEIL